MNIDKYNIEKEYTEFFKDHNRRGLKLLCRFISSIEEDTSDGVIPNLDVSTPKGKFQPKIKMYNERKNNSNNVF